MNIKKIIVIMVIAAAAAIGLYMFKSYRADALYRNPGFASGNGRLEATEVDIATKLSGRVESIKVNEGDRVQKGELLAKMQQLAEQRFTTLSPQMNSPTPLSFKKKPVWIQEAYYYRIIVVEKEKAAERSKQK